MKRPYPPIQDNQNTDVEDDEFIETGGLLHFEPANNDLWPWIRETFLESWGKLHNPDHEHLLSFQPPELSFLWAYTKCEAKDRRVLGQTERVMINIGGWRKARQEKQMIDWFGCVPKFIITIDAWFAHNASDTDFCALVEHELYHVGAKRDEDGNYLVSQSTGEYKYYLRPHDVEEFHGVVQRYGASPDVQKMVELANDGPTIGKAKIAHACGTCLLKLA